MPTSAAPALALRPRSGPGRVAGASAVAFAGLTLAVASGRLDELDRRAGPRLAVAEGSVPSRAAEVLSWLGPLPTTALISLLLAPSGRRRVPTAVRALVGLGLGSVLHHAIKKRFPRPRPTAARRGLEIPRSAARSFPSGHTIYAILLAGQAWIVRPSLPVRAGAIGWVLAMAGSRLALRAHWPSDVAGGALAGTALALTVWGRTVSQR